VINAALMAVVLKDNTNEAVWKIQVRVKVSWQLFFQQ
jgi:hypothetical protein